MPITETLSAAAQIAEAQLAEAQINELRAELASIYETNAALQAELASREQAEASHDAAIIANDQRNRDAELIEELQAEISSLQETLLVVRSNAWQNNSSSKSESRLADSSDSDSNEALKRLSDENADLREQNADLATQLARLQMSGHHNPPHLKLKPS